MRLSGGIPFGKKTVQSLKASLKIYPDDTIGATEFALGLYGNHAVA
jgi:hypothetical protein